MYQSISVEQHKYTERYRVNILAAFTAVSRFKIGFYTEGFAPFLCRSHSVLTEGVSTLPSSELVVSNGASTLREVSPPSYAPHSVLSDH